MIRDVSKGYAMLIESTKEDDIEYSKACDEACKKIQELEQREIDEYDEEVIDPSECGFTECDVQIDEVVDPLKMWNDMKKNDNGTALVPVNNNYIATMKKLLSSIRYKKSDVYDRVMQKLAEYQKTGVQLPPPEDYAENFVPFEELSKNFDPRSEEFTDTDNAFGNKDALDNIWDTMNEEEQETVKQDATTALKDIKRKAIDTDKAEVKKFLDANRMKIDNAKSQINDPVISDNIDQIVTFLGKYADGEFEQNPEMMNEGIGGILLMCVKGCIRFLNWILWGLSYGAVALGWFVKKVGELSTILCSKINSALNEGEILECDREDCEEVGADGVTPIDEADYREPASHLLDPVGVKASTASLKAQDTAMMSVVETLLKKIDKLEDRLDESQQQLAEWNNHRIDLSKRDGSMTKIIMDNHEKFDQCKTTEELIQVAHQLFDEAGLDTPATRKFFMILSQKKRYVDALTYIYASYLKGSGLGVYEGEDCCQDGECEDGECESCRAEKNSTEAASSKSALNEEKKIEIKDINTWYSHLMKACCSVPEDPNQIDSLLKIIKQIEDNLKTEYFDPGDWEKFSVLWKDHFCAQDLADYFAKTGNSYGTAVLQMAIAPLLDPEDNYKRAIKDFQNKSAECRRYLEQKKTSVQNVMTKLKEADDDKWTNMTEDEQDDEELRGFGLTDDQIAVLNAIKVVDEEPKLQRTLTPEEVKRFEYFRELSFKRELNDQEKKEFIALVKDVDPNDIYDIIDRLEGMSFFAKSEKFNYKDDMDNRQKLRSLRKKIQKLLDVAYIAKKKDQEAKFKDAMEQLHAYGSELDKISANDPLLKNIEDMDKENPVFIPQDQEDGTWNIEDWNAIISSMTDKQKKDLMDEIIAEIDAKYPDKKDKKQQQQRSAEIIYVWKIFGHKATTRDFGKAFNSSHAGAGKFINGTMDQWRDAIKLLCAQEHLEFKSDTFNEIVQDDRLFNKFKYILSELSKTRTRRKI